MEGRAVHHHEALDGRRLRGRREPRLLQAEHGHAPRRREEGAGPDARQDLQVISAFITKKVLDLDLQAWPEATAPSWAQLSDRAAHGFAADREARSRAA